MQILSLALSIQRRGKNGAMREREKKGYGEGINTAHTQQGREDLEKLHFLAWSLICILKKLSSFNIFFEKAVLEIGGLPFARKNCNLHTHCSAALRSLPKELRRALPSLFLRRQTATTQEIESCRSHKSASVPELTKIAAGGREEDRRRARKEKTRPGRRQRDAERDKTQWIVTSKCQLEAPQVALETRFCMTTAKRIFIYAQAEKDSCGIGKRKREEEMVEYGNSPTTRQHCPFLVHFVPASQKWLHLATVQN